MEVCPICGAVEGTGLKPAEFVDQNGRDWSFCYSGKDHGETSMVDQDANGKPVEHVVDIPTDPFIYTYDVNDYAYANGQKRSRFYNPKVFLFKAEYNGKTFTVSTVPWSQVTTGGPVEVKPN